MPKTISNCPFCPITLPEGSRCGVCTSPHLLRWEIADKQSSLDMGTFPADADREAEESRALAELIEECGSDADREVISAGAFIWVIR